MRRTLFIVAITAIAVACGSADPGGGSVEGAWTLESGSLDGQQVPIVEGHPITILLQGEEISGTAACNRYFGQYRVAGGDFSLVDGVAVTEMACGPEEVMESERAYLDTLLTVDSAQIVDGELVLNGERAELVYIADPEGVPPEASGTTLDPDTPVSDSLFGPDIQGAWELVSGSLDGEPIPVVESHPITLTVEGELIGGTAACNDYGLARRDAESEWEMSATAMACAPEEVMESEETYLTALLRAADSTLEDGELVLLGEGVELRFRALDPVPTTDMTGTVWVLESMSQGDAATPVSGERATLELFTDGSVIGSTGCRAFSGTYVINGAEVLLTELTMSGECPPDLADQDSRVVTVLGDGFRPEVDGDTLRLRSMGDEGLIYHSES